MKYKKKNQKYKTITSNVTVLYTKNWKKTRKKLKIVDFFIAKFDKNYLIN